MDGSQAGLVGGIAGGVIGLLGGVLGTYCSIKNARDPRSRSLMIRIAVVGWLLMIVVLVIPFVAPRPWGQLVSGLSLIPMFLAIPWLNRKLEEAAAKTEDRPM